MGEDSTTTNSTEVDITLLLDNYLYQELSDLTGPLKAHLDSLDPPESGDGTVSGEGGQTESIQEPTSRCLKMDRSGTQCTTIAILNPLGRVPHVHPPKVWPHNRGKLGDEAGN
jgi:hypothetical protein